MPSTSDIDVYVIRVGPIVKAIKKWRFLAVDQIEMLLAECPSAKERRIVMSKIGDSIAETSDRRLEDEFFLWKKDYKKKMKSDIKTKKNKKKLIIGIFLLVELIRRRKRNSLHPHRSCPLAVQDSFL